MSKSSKRRIAIAAIKNAADTAHPSATGTGVANPALPNSAESLLQAAAETASSPQRATDIRVEAATGGGDRPGRIGVGSPSALSTQNSALSPPRKTLQSILAEPPSEFFKTHFEPHCPPQDLESIELPPILRDPSNPAGPIDSQFEDYQSKLKPVFAQLSPSDPIVERIIHNYVIVMQIATVERLIHDLPGMSEAAQLETNNQIIRMLSIIERTNSRRARELREKDAATRRIIREQQRKERQAQKEQEALARNQRTQQREEQRRQREQAKADRAEQKHQLAMRKLDLKERDIITRERERAAASQHPLGEVEYRASHPSASFSTSARTDSTTADLEGCFTEKSKV